MYSHAVAAYECMAWHHCDCKEPDTAVTANTFDTKHWRSYCALNHLEQSQRRGRRLSLKGHHYAHNLFMQVRFLKGSTNTGTGALTTK